MPVRKCGQVQESAPVVREQRREILVFEVGGRRFGLPASSIRELARVVTIVPLPSAPPMVEGMVDFRGRAVPVLDIRPALRLPKKPLEPTDHLVFTRSRGRLVALRVDRALELVAWEEPGAADESPGAAGDASMARLSDGLAPIIDPDQLPGIDLPDALAGGGPLLAGSWSDREAAP